MYKPAHLGSAKRRSRLNLNNHDREEARRRIRLYMDAFRAGTRITKNLDFDASSRVVA